PVQHNVVGEGTNFLGRRIEQLQIVGMGRRERVVDRCEGTVLIALEHRKIRHPEERSLVLGYQRQSLSDILPHAIERRIADLIRACNQYAKLTLGDREALHTTFREKLCRWSLESRRTPLE